MSGNNHINSIYMRFLMGLYAARYKVKKKKKTWKSKSKLERNPNHRACIIGNFFFYTRFFYLSINLYTSYGVYSAPTRIYRRGAKSRIRINAYMKSKMLNAIRNTFRQPTTSVVKRKWLYQFWCLWLIVCSSVSVYSSILTFTDLYGKIPS